MDGVATHLALRGNAFFALEDGTYTRDGSFQMDADGRLVTRDGVAVLAEGAPVQADPTEQLSVGSDGTVTGSRSGSLGRLDAVALTNPQPLGGNRWGGNAGETPEGISFVQGALEGSNVDTMRGMVEMMEASRFFEAQQKAMQASDEIRSRLNRIGGN
jgi:flagellar basal body rod protein FlgG